MKDVSKQLLELRDVIHQSFLATSLAVLVEQLPGSAKE